MFVPVRVTCGQALCDKPATNRIIFWMNVPLCDEHLPYVDSLVCDMCYEEGNELYHPPGEIKAHGQTVCLKCFNERWNDQ